MITEYHRPESLDNALQLLARTDPRTLPLGGGLYINEVIKEPIAVVDLQELGLSEIKKKGKTVQLGATLTLQSLLDSGLAPYALQLAVKHQENFNRRQVATLAGTIVAAGGRSAITGTLLALDAELELVGEGLKSQSILLGDFLPLREEILVGKLITTVRVPAEVRVVYQYVARTPADLPIVGAAVCRWPSGRTRVVLLGYGEAPKMVFDGPNPDGAGLAAGSAYAGAGDQWAGEEYRSKMAQVLVVRCLNEIAQTNEG